MRLCFEDANTFRLAEVSVAHSTSDQQRVQLSWYIDRTLLLGTKELALGLY